MSELLQEQSPQAFKFDVFISYRHAPLDSAVAGYLQKALEHYKIPREIRKKCGKQSIHRVFRDEEELGVASDLFSQIEENLRQSEFLLVVCSPRILESKWCLREIETFIRCRGRDHVLAVLIEGEPETAFPPLLLEEGEPLAADLRGKSTRQVLRHARERMPRLAAPLLYCSYDELFQRHRVYRMRRMLALAGAVAAAAVCFGAVTLLQSREISRNYQGKLENQSRYLAQTSSQLLQQGDRDSALLVALEALPKGSGDTSRPYVAEARIALEDALYTYRLGYTYQLQPMKKLSHQGTLSTCSDYRADENVLLTADSRIYVWDADTCRQLCCWEDETRAFRDAKLVGGHLVAVLTETGIFAFDYRTARQVWSWDFPVCTNSSCYTASHSPIWSYDSVSGRLLCASAPLTYHFLPDFSAVELTDAHCLHLLDAATGQASSWAPEALYASLAGDPYSTCYLSGDLFSFSPDGKYIALATQRYDSGISTYTLRVLPLSGAESLLTREYTGEALTTSPLEALFWLDGDTLAVMRTVEGSFTMGMIGWQRTWEAECWDVPTGRLRFSHRDTSISVSSYLRAELLPPAGNGSHNGLVSFVNGNVQVCLDPSTGELLSRVEDRSPLVLTHIWSPTSEVVVTADGYLFGTSPSKDMVWPSSMTAYHYYLDLDPIRKAEWYGGKAFLFTETAVYCYTPPTDRSYTLLDHYPSSGFFTSDSRFLLLSGSDGILSLHDTGTLDSLWREQAIPSYNGSAALVDDRLVSFLSPQALQVCTRTLRGGEVSAVALDGGIPGLTESKNWALRSAGGTRVLVWNSETISLASYTGYTAQDLDCTALWLVDGSQGRVDASWTYRQLLELCPTSLSVDYLSITLTDPSVTSTGRFLFLPLKFTGYALAGQESADRQRLEQQCLLVWDLDRGTLLPRELLSGFSTSLSIGSYLALDGWRSPQGDLIVFFDRDQSLIQVVDLLQGSAVHQLSVTGVASKEIAFTPDGSHLVFQDGLKRLCVYNWRTGEYTMQGVTPEGGSARFSFYQGGQVLAVSLQYSGITTEYTQLYTRTGEGTYRHETSISPCGCTDGKTVVISDDTNPRLYRAYDLDSLIAAAGDILQGRQLTAAERRAYLID